MDTFFPQNLTTKQAVLATLSYFKCFNLGLTRSDLMEHLLFAELDEKKIDLYLQESSLINEENGIYFLKNGTSPDQSKKKEREIRKYWKRVRRYQWIFAICPYIKWVGVCNSLAFGDIDEKSDIDLFVVAENGRLFTARFFLTLITTIFGVRRHGKKTKKRFCLSFYITEKAQNLDAITIAPYDIYLAYWTKTIEPIAGDYQAYQNFIQSNSKWLKLYFKKLPFKKRHFRKTKDWQVKVKSFLEKRFSHNRWEFKFQKSQLTRARRKYLKLQDRSGTVLSKDMLKFHDRDIREELKNEWEQRVAKII
jgi:predicted nucleotidyltransferase